MTQIAYSHNFTTSIISRAFTTTIDLYILTIPNRSISFLPKTFTTQALPPTNNLGYPPSQQNHNPAPLPHVLHIITHIPTPPIYLHSNITSLPTTPQNVHRNLPQAQMPPPQHPRPHTALLRQKRNRSPVTRRSTAL